MAKKTLRERFDAKVKENGESGCWIWTGSHDGANYGRISLNGKPAQASRVAYTLYRGPIPEGQVLDHHLYPEGGCIGPACVNPSHLLPTTQSENASRNAWSRKTHCPQGHPYNIENTVVEKTRKGRLARRCKKCKIAGIGRWQLKHPDKVKEYRAISRQRKVDKRIRSVPTGNTKAA